MPELPDVEVFRRRLVAATRRRRLLGVEVHDADVLAGVGTRSLDRALADGSVTATHRHGKHLYVITRDGPQLRLHFGMTAFLVPVSETEELPTHTRVVFRLSGNRRLLFVDQRKLGEVGLVESVDEDIRRRGLGPDALSIEPSRLSSLLRESRGALKPTLMDQSRIAGLGNIYTDEILFQARLDPRAGAAAVTGPGVRRLHRQLGRILGRAIEGEVQDFPRGWLLHRRRAGVECPRGDGLVERYTSAGRHGYFCPGCQGART